MVIMKTMRFQTEVALSDWVNDPANANITVVTIVADSANGGFILFYR
jgi:hypothetical protein